MRRLSLVAAALAFGLAACADEPISAPDGPSAAVSANAPVYLVMFHDGVDAAVAARDIAGARGLALRHVWSVANGFSAPMSPRLAAQLRGDARVKLVEEDRAISLIAPIRGAAPPWCADNPDDPRCGGDDGGGSSQVTPWGVARVGGPADGTGRTAWVIDTGVDFEHADLTVDQGCSANFVTRGKNSADDGNGHGTHVAGTIAALNNSQDVVGVAAGARICAVRVLDNSGSGTWEWVINGVDYVGANAASGDVANMSLGGTASGSEPNALEQAIMNAADKGIRFSIAAGNSGDYAENYTPARLDYANVFTVSATDGNDCLASWSNWGNPPVDYADPGVSILSTKSGGGTTTMSGTSMAAPHLAGILLLGTPASGGTASCDPDGNPDTIGVL